MGFVRTYLHHLPVGGPSLFLSELVAVSDAVSATRSRNEKVRLLAEALSAMEDDERAAGIAYLSGEPRQVRLDVGWSAVGGVDVAPARDSSLALLDVDAILEAVASQAGAGSRGARLDLLDDLFRRATSEEQAYLRTLLLRNTRQGALEGVMVKAVAEAAGVAEEDVRRALMLSADLAAVAAAAFEGGAEALASIRLEVFRPVQPMLAQTAPTVREALASVGGRASVEFKLDGMRVQVHRRGDEVAVYTRNLRDVTAEMPAVVEVARSLAVEEVVLDGEAMRWTAGGAPVAFQDTMSKPGDASPLLPRFFDVIRLDGQDLLDSPTSERWDALRRIVPEEHRILAEVLAEPVAATDLLRAALDAGHEGVMVKALDAPYEAGRRGATWLKVKPAHTLDLVVLAVEWGSGRRQGWLSNVHLGARDEESGEFVMLGKTFKGMTDEMLAWQTERFLELEVRRTKHVVHLRPAQVVEIAFDAVQTSTRYPGGMALRFARVKRYREDKDPADADTLQTVRAIHRGEIRPRIPDDT